MYDRPPGLSSSDTPILSGCQTGPAKDMPGVLSYVYFTVTITTPCDGTSTVISAGAVTS
jgi:hypothetical protein